MRLLNTRTGEFKWVENPNQFRYAALSHVWSKDPRRETSYGDIARFQEEVRFARARGEVLPEDAVLSKASYKIRGACALARADGIDWLWVDTCCIDKASSAELEGAINAMYEWYASSTVCYVFLQDVDAHEDPFALGSCFRQSEWHARGWTLQELIAPQAVLFFSRSWHFIGAKHGLANLVADVTGVDREVITGEQRVDAVSVSRRMSWASRRITTKREDEAYCLMGILGVHIPVVYGEGPMAFLRLQEELLRRVPDESIFVWDRALYPRTSPQSTAWSGSSEGAQPVLLASSPACFAGSAEVVCVPKGRLSEALGVHIPPSSYTVTSHGLRTTLPLLCLTDDVFVALLACQRNDLLLGMLVKKTSTTDVYSIGVSDFSSEHISRAHGLPCMVQLPLPLDSTPFSSASPKPLVSVREINLPSYVPSRPVSLPLSNSLRSHVLGLSERSVRCLASIGYRTSHTTSSSSRTTITLSSFEGTRVGSVELKRCKCSGTLKSGPDQPYVFAMRVTPASSTPAVPDYHDTSNVAQAPPELCTCEYGWRHLQVSVPNVTPASTPSSDAAEHLLSSSPLSPRNAGLVQLLPSRHSAVLRLGRGPGGYTHQLVLALTCDYPGDDRYPARFTLSIDPLLRGDVTSTRSSASTSTLTCPDEWLPSIDSPSRLVGHGDADLPQLLKERAGDDDHGDPGSRTYMQSKEGEARPTTRLLQVLTRVPTRIWTVVKRVALCQKQGWESPAPSVYCGNKKRGREVSRQSLPCIVVYEASAVSTR